MTPSIEERREARRLAREDLWRAGELRWKLDATQRKLYDDIRACASGLFSTEGARKLGKSWLHGVIALETAERNPGKQINWAAITGKECRLVLEPILEQLSMDAPEDCKGRYDGQNNQWRLPNGAWIQLIGADTREDCEKGRGPSAILNIVDEAGFHNHLEYLVESILEPQMRRVRRAVGGFVGMTLLVSTTPYTPTHKFCSIADAADLRGAYRKLTIWDSGWETREDIERYIAAQAANKNMTVAEFMATTHFRREYLSERVVDEDIVVFPEFHSKREAVVKDWPRPVGFHEYVHKRVSIDLGGMRDKYGFLYGYTDFAGGKIVIEDEALLSKPNTEQVAREIVERIDKLWPDVRREKLSIVIDDDQERMIRDLWDIHKVRAHRATKQNHLGGRAASIGMIRSFLQMESIVIHPRCVELRKQLLTATRNRVGNDFERTPEGHYDLCASLMYMVRDISLTHNPYPASFNVLTGRALPDHHSLVARQEQMGKPRELRGIAGALLGSNRYVGGQLRRRR